MNDKMIRIFLCFVCFVLLGFCKSQVNEKIENNTNQCINTFLLAEANAGRSGFSGTFEFLSSCSATSNYSPSCIEYYATSSKTITCAPGYTKSSAKCSTQNLIGVCRYQPDGITTEVNTIVFAKPNDTKEEAINKCQTISSNGIFTENYLRPNERMTSFDILFTNFYLCYEKAQKN
ncbi:hypothetical protein P3G55_14900 [Leptospira sp. 96542]|nr:hypothetical protein [Leptospira sp. 96542]